MNSKDSALAARKVLPFAGRAKESGWNLVPPAYRDERRFLTDYAEMRSIFQSPLQKKHLVADLEAAGIKSGDVLLVHSSLRKVGWLLGGPESLIESFEDIIGPQGTLVMPTFTFSLVSWRMPPFRVNKTASRVGKLTEVFWRQPGALRSTHPTHSFAARGVYAREIIQQPHGYEPLGVGGPIDVVRRLGGKILLLGVGNNRNSTIHLAESIAGMPYLRVPFSDKEPYDRAIRIEEDGSEQDVRIHEMPGSSEGFTVLDHHLVDCGVARKATIGYAPSFVMQSEPLCGEVCRLLHDHPTFLLESGQPSEITTRRLAFMASMTSDRDTTPAGEKLAS